MFNQKDKKENGIFDKIVTTIIIWTVVWSIYGIAVKTEKGQNIKKTIFSYISKNIKKLVILLENTYLSSFLYIFNVKKKKNNKK